MSEIAKALKLIAEAIESGEVNTSELRISFLLKEPKASTKKGK